MEKLQKIEGAHRKRPYVTSDKLQDSPCNLEQKRRI